MTGGLPRMTVSVETRYFPQAQVEAVGLKLGFQRDITLDQRRVCPLAAG